MLLGSRCEDRLRLAHGEFCNSVYRESCRIEEEALYSASARVE